MGVQIDSMSRKGRNKNYHRRRFALPDLRFATTIPCLLTRPDLFGRGVMPFDALHSSRREPRGPWVDTLAGAVAAGSATPVSSSIFSVRI